MHKAGKEKTVTQKEYYDYREDENTRQVSLSKLMRCALMRWKVILLAGIILGGLLGSYKILSIHSKKDQMIKEYDAYKTKLETYNSSVEQYKKTISSYQKSVNDRIDYINNSPKMNLNFASCPSAFTELSITSTGEAALSTTAINSIMNAVSDEVSYGDAMTRVAENHEMSSEFMRELISVKLLATGSVVRVTVHGEDTEQARAVRDELIDIILNEKVKGLAPLGNFELTVVNEGVANVFDAEIQLYQAQQKEALSKLQTQLNNAINQSNGLTKPTAVDQYSKKYMLKNGIKLGIVGFAAGIILALAAVLVMIIQKGVVLSPEEIDGEFGLKTLADFTDKETDEAAKLDFMMARIENCMAGKAGGEIGIVGSVSDELIEKLASELNGKAADAKDSLKFSAVPAFNKDAQAFRRLKELSGVILAEQIGKSDYIAIRKEVALIAESGRDLVGTVYF